MLPKNTTQAKSLAPLKSNHVSLKKKTKSNSKEMKRIKKPMLLKMMNPMLSRIKKSVNLKMEPVILK